MLRASSGRLLSLGMASASSQPLGRGYVKIQDIGQGSYGKAVLCQDREGKLYVMKLIDISRMDTKQRSDAVNEVRVLSSLKHPYIVSYRESFCEGRNLAIVMDYADGGDLHQRIRKMRHEGRVFGEDRVLRWFTEATLALKYLHDKYVLHRDLKSQNLFLTSQDRLRLGDFGISKVLESTAAFAMTAIGTPYYLSPEICMEQPYSFASDVWSLGCVLYELAALRVPFDAPSLQVLVQKITRGPAPSLPAYSPEMRQLCGDLLHRDQTQRPSAQEILQRPIVQDEIRRMLREEQSKGAAQSARAMVESPLRPRSLTDGNEGMRAPLAPVMVQRKSFVAHRPSLHEAQDGDASSARHRAEYGQMVLGLGAQREGDGDIRFSRNPSKQLPIPSRVASPSPSVSRSPQQHHSRW